MKNNSYVLPIIVVAQFACTSLWFAGNAVIGDIIQTFSLPSNALGNIISAVQFGFIFGTLVFAIFTISDRFSPSKVFFAAAVAGALFNLLIFVQGSYFTLIGSRFLTGFCLAGIYPVGMKIAADYHEKGLGKALGYLVGALVLGTALPHLIKGFTLGLPWEYVLFSTSILSVIGGISVIILVPDGPFRRSSSQPDFTAFLAIFKQPRFRAAAFGYFGHMWELYAFWTFVPLILAHYQLLHPDFMNNPSILAFVIIAIGGVGCVAGGYLSLKIGSSKTAFIALAISGICCGISPFLYEMPLGLFLTILLLWGMAVIADSPQFSTLVAQNADTEVKGTALTIVNSIGFFITIISIQLLTLLMELVAFEYLFLALSVGPVFGLFATRYLVRTPFL